MPAAISARCAGFDNFANAGSSFESAITPPARRKPQTINHSHRNRPFDAPRREYKWKRALLVRPVHSGEEHERTARVRIVHGERRLERSGVPAAIFARHDLHGF